MTDSSNSHVTPTESILAALDQEHQTNQGLDDTPGYIPFKIAIQETKTSDEPIDMSDMLLLAWILMMCRSNGNQSVRCAWGYTQVPADEASTADVWVDREGQLSDILETISRLRKDAPLSPGLLAEPDGCYMFINDALDGSNGHSDWSYQLEVRECTISDCEHTLSLKPSWRSEVMAKSEASVLLASFQLILKSVLSNQNQSIADILELSR